MSQRLKHLSLSSFRLFESAETKTDAEIVCFHGLNGAGKTSLLEAIHYLCIGKGYFSQTDQQNIKFGGNFFRIEGVFVTDDDACNVVCALAEGKRKQIRVDGKARDRLVDHLGRFPVVVIAPDDVAIINGSPEQRRKFLDNMISQVSADYAESLQHYNKTLRQRNAALKQFAETGKVDRALLQSYDVQLTEVGSVLFELRKKHVATLAPQFVELHTSIAPGHEKPGLKYVSELHENGMHELLSKSVEQDLIMERTLHGPHRDDLDFTIDGRPIKRFGSQGQVKTFLVALKLAMFRFLKQELSKTPILLLDDLFDKLDEERAQQALILAKSGEIGQIFITETQLERVRKFVSDAGKSVSYNHIKEGEIEWPTQMKARFERSSATS